MGVKQECVCVCVRLCVCACMLCVCCGAHSTRGVICVTGWYAKCWLAPARWYQTSERTQAFYIDLQWTCYNEHETNNTNMNDILTQGKFNFGQRVGKNGSVNALCAVKLTLITPPILCHWLICKGLTSTCICLRSDLTPLKARKQFTYTYNGHTGVTHMSSRCCTSDVHMYLEEACTARVCSLHYTWHTPRRWRR